MKEITPTWSAEQSEKALSQALAAAGLKGDSAELIRFGSNALYRIHGTELLLRVSPPAHSLEDVRRTMRTASTLAAGGILVPMPQSLWSGSPLIELESGMIVGAWEWIDEAGENPGPADLGRVLRQIHSLPELDVSLPLWKPMANVYSRLEAAESVPRWISARLSTEAGAVEAALQDMVYDLRPGAIHGDAHMGNLIASKKGIVLLDLDDFCHGPREYDLAPTLVAARRFGLGESGWQAFCRAYGCDLTLEGVAGPLVRLRQLTMTTWLMDQWGSRPQVNAEIELRVRSMDEERGPWTRWTAF